MKRPPRPGVLLVATRELRWMRRDRLALFLAIGVPLIAFALLSFTFSDPVIRHLRVSVVDDDRSPTSMTFIQAIASAPGVTVAERSADLTSAMHAIRSGDAIASVYIPPGFEHDLQSNKRPQIVAFFNRQYMTPGNAASSAISAAIGAATASVSQKSPAQSYRPGTLVIEQYALTNPALNYAQFLLRAILPTVLHVVVALSAGYAVGSEFRARSRRAWLKAAGGSPLVALVGKLGPLFGVFLVMASVGSGIIHGLFAVPFRGDVAMMGAAACLFIVAYLAMGALFQLLTRNLALGLSLTGILCSPAFGFAGVGFPIFGMNGFARSWGDLLPLRWYIQILFDQAVRGLPTWTTAPSFAALGGLAIALSAL
ncbi:MAG TPA: ABC transporter permease, partial [Roseiarcus sp.]|nr:ABC transporter permease [Roseiarcus sp.]